MVALLAALAAPTRASAQAGGPGILFQRPRVAGGIRVGYQVPRAGGDLFGQTLDEFIPAGADTLASLSFNAPYVGGELAFRPWERWDVALGFGWTRSRTVSEYRRWVDNLNAPIEQETTFQLITGTLGAKYYFLDRGRRVGRLAWVPSRLAPFVGAGVGVASYEFRQVGDFIDTSTLEILNDYQESRGEGFLGYGAAGLDLVVARNAIVTAEARYTLSNAAVRGSYVGFRDMDLAGLQLMVGLGFQF
jgi:opacity protein-like surface antigen